MKPRISGRTVLLSLLFALMTALAIAGGCSGGGSSSTSSSTSAGAGASAPPAPSGPPAASSPPAASGAVVNAMDVVTYHNDIGRTGQQLAETVLTPANVNSTTFGKLAVFPVDGPVDAQPLFLASVSIAGGTRNVLYVATENASVYAFDADTGATLWKTTTLASGETPSDDHGCGQISPTIGITATPVIDRTRGPNGAMYVVGIPTDISALPDKALRAPLKTLLIYS